MHVGKIGIPIKKIPILKIKGDRWSSKRIINGRSRFQTTFGRSIVQGIRENARALPTAPRTPTKKTQYREGKKGGKKNG